MEVADAKIDRGIDVLTRHALDITIFPRWSNPLEAVHMSYWLAQTPVCSVHRCRQYRVDDTINSDRILDGIEEKHGEDGLELFPANGDHSEAHSK